MPPVLLSEDVPFDPAVHNCEPLDLWKPLGGHLWWNSLFWTNFPPLAMLQDAVQAADDGTSSAENPFAAALRLVNSDNQLAEQYVTFGSAREDLCRSMKTDLKPITLTCEVLQYEGVKEVDWDFPLESYAARRDNHQPGDLQARRFADNGVLHLGLNAEEFSERIRPVGDLDAVIHIADKAASENDSWGYCHAVMRIEGWPFRIKRLGSFEGYGEGLRREATFGICQWDESLLWDLLEGDSPDGQLPRANLRKGRKYWASLMDLDWLGPRAAGDGSGSCEIPVEKGYVWFVVEDSIEALESTGKHAVRIRMLEEGVIPAWLDLNFLQVFAGGMALGFLDTMQSAGPPRGSVEALRILSGPLEEDAERAIVVKNEHSRIVFDEPLTLPPSDFVDLGWAILDCCYQGSTIRVSPKPGKLSASAGNDEGSIATKAAGPPRLCHGEGPDKIMAGPAKSNLPYDRNLVM